MDFDTYIKTNFRNSVIQKLDLSRQVAEKTIGYFYVYDPSHPLANKAGKVYVHRYIASIKIGRYLDRGEHAHHINGDRKDNSVENLEVLTASEHTTRHFVGSEGSTEVICSCCGKYFRCCNSRLSNSVSGNLYCSVTCAQSSSAIIDVDPAILAKLVWEQPTVAIAKLLGVSDTAVSKYCKKHCITKPPGGYWAKTRACCSGVV